MEAIEGQRTEFDVKAAELTRKESDLQEKLKGHDEVKGQLLALRTEVERVRELKSAHAVAKAEVGVCQSRFEQLDADRESLREARDAVNAQQSVIAAIDGKTDPLEKQRCAATLKIRAEPRAIPER